MEEYIADLQEQLITAQHRFMKMHRDLCFTGLRKSEFVMLEIIERENGNREQGDAGIRYCQAPEDHGSGSLKNVKKHGRKGVCRTKSG